MIYSTSELDAEKEPVEVQLAEFDDVYCPITQARRVQLLQLRYKSGQLQLRFKSGLLEICPGSVLLACYFCYSCDFVVFVRGVLGSKTNLCYFCNIYRHFRAFLYFFSFQALNFVTFVTLAIVAIFVNEFVIIFQQLSLLRKLRK